MELVSLAEASHRLGVSERQARNLAEAGEIALVARGVVDAESVSAYLRNRGLVARRVWSEGTAWAAIGLLAEVDFRWIGASQISRLRRQISSMDAAELMSRLRNRATIHRFDGHRSVIAKVADELVCGSTAIGGLAVRVETNGYLAEDHLDELVDRFHLRAASAGPITVRCTRHLGAAREIAARDADLLTAIGLAASADAREREMALVVLADRVAALKAQVRPGGHPTT